MYVCICETRDSHWFIRFFFVCTEWKSFCRLLDCCSQINSVVFKRISTVTNGKELRYTQRGNETLFYSVLSYLYASYTCQRKANFKLLCIFFHKFLFILKSFDWIFSTKIYSMVIIINIVCVKMWSQIVTILFFLKINLIFLYLLLLWENFEIVNWLICSWMWCEWSRFQIVQEVKKKPNDQISGIRKLSWKSSEITKKLKEAKRRSGWKASWIILFVWQKSI